MPAEANTEMANSAQGRTAARKQALHYNDVRASKTAAVVVFVAQSFGLCVMR
jgi:hypothetical protein